MLIEEPDQTTVTDPKWVAKLLLVGVPVVGALVGWGLVFAVAWIVGLPWFPFQGPMELFNRLPDAVRPLVGIGLGAAVGLALAFFALNELITVIVDSKRIETKRGEDVQTAEAVAVESVFVANKRMVALGHQGEELIRVEFDLERDELAKALRRHGYTWLEGGDPFESEYRLWVPDAEGLPAGANPVFKARQIAIENSKNDDAAELREELAKLGVVVRDKDKKQYWRTTAD
ncbi:YqeB family protein [Glycomyces buryatensis]|uniref:YqeB family protein n=1 Tax=Glycomyces buryatensis TaxID=2570927 RepID=UPI001FEC3A3A|nr:hypothetical protein [Glycomyces buryatensis]